MITSVEQMIDALGGTSAAADLVGIDKRVVSNWKARGRVPAGYFFALTDALGAEGKEVDPAIFGMKASVEARA